MEKTIYRKKMKHYDIPGHAHELTFSCYSCNPYLIDPNLCNIFLEELNQARGTHYFKLWAYVLMPSHVHLLIWPYQQLYKISDILQCIKGRTSKRYRDTLIETGLQIYESFCLNQNGRKCFRLWQAGGGFDRNLWNSKPIHNSIRYIEGNPVRAGLVDSPEEWKWSSAKARITGEGLIPDSSEIPILMK